MKPNTYRRISQIIFFLLFLYLLNRTDYSGTDELKYPVKIFLDIDPLIAISTFLATHTIPLLLWLSFITLALTAVFGRFFCGWLCPFGSINQFFSFVFARKKRPRRGAYAKYQKTKYVILFVFLGSAVLGLNLSGFLDPLSLTVRSFTVGILPLTNSLGKAILYPLLGSDSEFVQRFMIPLYSNTKDVLFSYTDSHYFQTYLILALFIGFILLNLVKNRFFCRVICPLGALLGACSKYSVLELDQSELCTSCLGCASTAQGGASPEIRGEWKKSECVLCLNCVSGCGKNSLKFKFATAKDRKKGMIDLKRREIAFSMIGGLALAPLIKLNSRKNSSDPGLVRPPGSLNEKDFLKTCIKCEECMKVCPTNVLEPTLMKAGIEGMWSPYLDMSKGYCEYSCNLCGQVCPTGAIKKLPVEEKQKTKMGTAFIDKSICLPWASNTPCLVCEEHCPTSPKAIELRGGRGKGFGSLRPKRPQVNPNNCIGCGICQNKCPVEGIKAIRVTNAGENRFAQI